MMDDLDFNGVHVIHEMITMKSFDIFDESEHPPGTGMMTEYSGGEELRDHLYNLLIFPHGCGEQNKGYVSVMLDHALQATPFQGNCIVSLVDASETQIFSQSAIISDQEYPPMYIDKFISHEKLLGDPGDLVPNGTLTLQIEVWLKVHRLKLIRPDYDNFIKKFTKNSLIELNFDCPIGKRFSEESNVFRAMLDTPMIEKRTKSMPVFDRKGLRTLLNIIKLLMGGAILKFGSIGPVLDMYIFADKYDMPFVSDTCTCFLKLYLSLHGTDKLLEAVDRFLRFQHYLKELLVNYINLISQTNFHEEIDKTDIRGVSMKQPHGNYLWVYKYLENDNWPHFFLNKNAQNKSNFWNEEHEEYDFYK